MQEGSEGEGERTHFELEMGAAKLRFVGAASTLKETVMPVAQQMIALVDTHASLQQAPIVRQIEAVTAPVEATGEKPPILDGSSVPLGHSTSTIAVALNAQKAPELAMAACAHLTLVKMKATFAHKEILDEMKTATGFYDKNMGKNHGQTIEGLTKAKKLHQMSDGKYALSNDSKTKLSAALAEIK